MNITDIIDRGSREIVIRERLNSDYPFGTFAELVLKFFDSLEEAEHCKEHMSVNAWLRAISELASVTAVLRDLVAP